MLAATLEQTLVRAIAIANDRNHELATLEHLLLALLDDPDALAALRACGADIDKIHSDLRRYIDDALIGLVNENRDDAQPTIGFQRVIQRAMVQVESAGRERVTGANILVAMFGERDSFAVYFLNRHKVSRIDLMELHGTWHRQGAAGQKCQWRAG